MVLATTRTVLVAWFVATAVVGAGCADPFIESTTVLGDTSDANGPYRVAVVALGTSGSDLVELHSQAGDDVSVVILRAADDDGDGPSELHLGGIGGQPPGTQISYHIEIDRDGETVSRDPVGAGSFVFMVTP